MAHHQHSRKGSSRKHSGKSSSKTPGRDEAAKHSNTDTHPKIEDDFPDAKQHIYFGRDLVRTLKYNSEKDITTRLDDREIELLRLPVPSPKSAREAKKLMKMYFLIFDRAFFFNLLGKDLQDHIGMYDDAEHGARLGFCDNGIIHINMTNREPSGSLGEKQLSVLLHEMLHAFLDYYTCNCSKCEKRTAAQGGSGLSSHGSTWANAMTYLQASLNREVSWDVRCGIERGVNSEMKLSRWQPRFEQFERWKMTPSIAPDVKKRHKHGKHKKGLNKSSPCEIM